MSPYPIGLKNPRLVETIDMGWQLKAELCGYASEFTMLKHLYTYEELTDRQIGQLLDKSDRTITGRRKKYGIKSRPRGGANNPWGRTGKRTKRNGLVVPQSAEDVKVRY